MRVGLFIPTVKATEWAREVLGGLSPAELPVGGKRLVEYNIEYCENNGFEMAEVLDWTYSAKVESRFADLTYFKLPVFYCRGTGPLPEGLDDLVNQPTPLTQSIGEGTSVLWGIGIATGAAPDEGVLEEVTPEGCAHTPAGMYRWRDGKWYRVANQTFTIESVADWHAANMRVLNSPDSYNLPGYSAEKGVYLGRNVVMEHGTEAKAPVILQDDVWCARNVRLEGNVVIGKRSFVSEGASLLRTVVCNDTYIGTGLEFEDKIVLGQRIIDAKSGTWTDVEDPGMTRTLKEGRGVFARLWDFLRGNSRGRA